MGPAALTVAVQHLRVALLRHRPAARCLYARSAPEPLRLLLLLCTPATTMAAPSSASRPAPSPIVLRKHPRVPRRCPLSFPSASVHRRGQAQCPAASSVREHAIPPSPPLRRRPVWTHALQRRCGRAVPVPCRSAAPPHLRDVRRSRPYSVTTDRTSPVPLLWKMKEGYNSKRNFIQGCRCEILDSFE